MEDKELETAILNSLKRHNIDKSQRKEILNDIDSEIRDIKWRKDWYKVQEKSGDPPYPHF